MIPVSKNRKSFTLIELILVIIIMGIAYSFIGNSIFKKENAITIKLKNLPEIARSLEKKPLEFIIYGRDCQNMVWLYNKSEPIEVKYKVKINAKHLKAYKFNFYGELDEFQFQDFRVENRTERVCLRFELFKNSSNSSYVIEDKSAELFYLFYPFFKKVEISKSFSDIEERFLSESLNPETL